MRIDTNQLISIGRLSIGENMNYPRYIKFEVGKVYHEEYRPQWEYMCVKRNPKTGYVSFQENRKFSRGDIISRKVKVIDMRFQNDGIYECIDIHKIGTNHRICAVDEVGYTKRGRWDLKRDYPDAYNWFTQKNR